MELSAHIKPQPRTFLPPDWQLRTWSDAAPFFDALEQAPIKSLNELHTWLHHLSELSAVVSEAACWKQINTTRYTDNETYRTDFEQFCMQVQPQIEVYANTLNHKLLRSPFINELDTDTYYTYLRTIRNSIAIFREANTQLQAQLNVEQQQYAEFISKMNIQFNDQEYTLPQAAKFLEHPDRNTRETVFLKINKRRLEDKNTLDQLYTNLVTKRHQVAINAGFENYVGYKFAELGRFDYTIADCFDFHQAVQQTVLPLVNELYQFKKEKLQLDTLRPWDIEAEPAHLKPLQPFEQGAELLRKTIQCLGRIHPFFGACLETMQAMQRFDLESRPNKAPGGYNCPLAETGAPFIFMNATGQMHDVTTMVHEAGHAIHSFLAHPLPLNAFKEYPMEIAEVASMAMELLSMDHWDIFFEDKNDLKRAKAHQLERVITLFPWIALVDAFQHWVYTHPAHTEAERKNEWLALQQAFTTQVIDYSGLESYQAYSWQKQLHLYEVPFYYIEYGIAQLGAIGLWRQYKTNPTRAIENYITALQLGNTKTLPELYRAAGLPFSFSAQYMQELMEFVRNEWLALHG